MNLFELKDSGKSVYEQLSGQGVYLDIGCGEGVCGQCKVRFISGVFEYHRDILACLYEDEIVSCCAFPKGHLIVGV